MLLLFPHQNFPGQFKHLAPALARQGHTVVAMTMQKTEARLWQGVRLVPYAASRGTSPTVHPWVSDFETKIIRAEACFRAARELRAQGFVPEAIIAHPGWWGFSTARGWWRRCVRFWMTPRRASAWARTPAPLPRHTMT